MFLRFVAESIRRSPRRKALTVAAVAMGTAVATSMLGVMLDIGDKVNVELRSMGANILVTLRAPAPSFIPEAEVPKIKSIFWALNITGYAPSLTVRTPDFPVRGVLFDRMRSMNPAWKVNGHWPAETECLTGAAVAARLHLAPGSPLPLLGKKFNVAGVLSTGSDEDEQILVRLSDLQPLVHREGQVDAIQVAALTKPEDDFARKDPAKMNAQDLERWNCTNYVRSIAHEIEGVLPMAVAKPVWRVADSEGKVLSKIGGLMLLIALAALMAAGLTVWSVMAATVLERRGEIAIMQATGASDALIAALFSAEVAIEGFLGGLIGVLAGLQLARWVGRSVFGSGIEAPAILGPLAIIIAMAVALAGALPPLRRSLALPPAMVLRERV